MLSLKISNNPKIKNIPYIKGMKGLYVFNCKEVKNIENSKELTKLFISNCDNFYNIDTIDNKKINEYLSSICIKRWYKKYKHFKTLWKIAEYYTKRKYSPENILNYVYLEI